VDKCLASATAGEGDGRVGGFNQEGRGARKGAWGVGLREKFNLNRLEGRFEGSGNTLG
jgi:hypothetical protein